MPGPRHLQDQPGPGRPGAPPRRCSGQCPHPPAGLHARRCQVAADRPSYSGKHRKHGMNLQVIASLAGEIS